MKASTLIDLSLPISPDLPVFPGDLSVEVRQIQTLDQDGWDMKRISINSHDGTHVNVPSHAVADGKTLEAFSLENFIGRCTLESIESGKGVIITGQITDEIYQTILTTRPRFVGFDHMLCGEQELVFEKGLLEAGIIFYENLVNIDLLPAEFDFYGVPLAIVDGDGSPVRAFAMID